MRILWLTWKDRKHPQAGGAEVVNEELAKRLVHDGHEVTLLVGGFNGGAGEETIHGYKIVRLGNRFTVYWHAYCYYKKHFQGWADIIIDEINTMPFFAKYYARERNVLFVHQLCRQIWFYQLPKYLGWIGYFAEPIYLHLLNDRQTITVSNSTRNDLLRYGFKPTNIQIISEGISIKPVASLQTITKFKQPTVLSLGSIRAMKRTLEQVQAFEIAKKSIPNLQLKLAGDSSDPYGQKVLRYIKGSPYERDIEYLGTVTQEQKATLLQKCHLILVSSVKEGWGLVVTEANSQGTPAIAYDVDGLRDSVQNGVTGIVCEPSPASMAANILNALSEFDMYDKMRQRAYARSKKVTFDKSYKDFKRGLRLE